MPKKYPVRTARFALALVLLAALVGLGSANAHPPVADPHRGCIGVGSTAPRPFTSPNHQVIVGAVSDIDHAQGGCSVPAEHFGSIDFWSHASSCNAPLKYGVGCFGTTFSGMPQCILESPNLTGAQLGRAVLATDTNGDGFSNELDVSAPGDPMGPLHRVSEEVFIYPVGAGIPFQIDVYTLPHPGRLMVFPLGDDGGVLGSSLPKFIVIANCLEN